MLPRSSTQLDGVSVHAGFPNPATDSSLDELDLNRLLIQHPAGTYFMRISGRDWEEQGIYDGDIAIIDRVIRPHPIDLVIWWEGENFVIGPAYKVRAHTPVWGVVSSIIHQYRGQT